MSGFRKFRSGLHRRRRSIEAVELGYLGGGLSKGLPGPGPVRGTPPAPESPRDVAESNLPQSDVPASREAIEIGPQPIAWLKPKRQDTDN